MSAMEEYKDLLKIAYKFEKLDMIKNAKKLYKKYVELVSNHDYMSIFDYFYGQNTFYYLEINSVDEAINKAFIAEKLKKLYYLMNNYRTDWNKAQNALDSNNTALMKFFRWLSTDEYVSNDDLVIINQSIDLLDSGVCFNIKCADLTLIDIFNRVVSNSLSVDLHRNELI